MQHGSTGPETAERCAGLYQELLHLGERLAESLKDEEVTDWEGLLQEREALIVTCNAEMQAVLGRPGGLSQANRERLQHVLSAVVAQNRVLEQLLGDALRANTGHRAAINQAKTTVGAYARVGVAREARFLDHKK